MRILPRGEIESLERTRVARLRFPEPAGVFSDRASRLRSLAESSPLADYLKLMAVLADAQQRALREFTPPAPDAKQVEQSFEHNMPPLQPATAPRNAPAVLGLLARLLDDVIKADGVPAAAAEACAALRERVDSAPEEIEEIADALLAAGYDSVDVEPAAAPFVMAALQVYWTGMAAAFDQDKVPSGPFGVCPVCGTPPVASVVRIGGKYDGYRYLCCPLCSVETHLVRVTCSHCSETKGIAYHHIEGGSEAIKAETCESCKSYRKIFYQNKDQFVEPVADDLASLALDVLMGEEGYTRSSGNPLLWQARGD